MSVLHRMLLRYPIKFLACTDCTISFKIFEISFISGVSRDFATLCNTAENGHVNSSIFILTTDIDPFGQQKAGNLRANTTRMRKIPFSITIGIFKGHEIFVRPFQITNKEYRGAGGEGVLFLFSKWIGNFREDKSEKLL